jgi:hypothetical protein
MAITDFLPGVGGSDPSALDEMCGGFKLTRTQRFYGFGALLWLLPLW